MNTILRKIGIWGAVLVIFGGIGWGMVKLSSNVVLPTTEGVLTVAVGSNDHILGPTNAPVTLVEYGDFQCPACASFHTVVKQLLREPDVKDNVRLVFRHFPLTQLHANAQLASQAAEAAAIQGKFWEMYDILYENQKAWSLQSGAAVRTTFESYAKDLKMNVGQFKTDIDSANVKARIQADVASATSANVQGTPTFFVNGKKMAQAQSFEQFKQFVLDGASTPQP